MAFLVNMAEQFLFYESKWIKFQRREEIMAMKPEIIEVLKIHVLWAFQATGD